MQKTAPLNFCTPPDQMQKTAPLNFCTPPDQMQKTAPLNFCTPPDQMQKTAQLNFCTPPDHLGGSADCIMLMAIRYKSARHFPPGFVSFFRCRFTSPALPVPLPGDPFAGFFPHWSWAVHPGIRFLRAVCRWPVFFCSVPSVLPQWLSLPV